MQSAFSRSLTEKYSSKINERDRKRGNMAPVKIMLSPIKNLPKIAKEIKQKLKFLLFTKTGIHI